MARERVVLSREPTAVRYPASRFALLKEKRSRAREFLEVLPAGTLVFGSVARGDVRPASDIDLEVPYGIASFGLEVALSRLEDPWVGRRLVQATPNSVVKALWDFGEKVVALPLTPPSSLETGFAHFGGAVGRDGILRSDRVAGVDKRLMLIEPTARGHIESSVADRVQQAAAVLNIDADVIRGRLRVLKRRSQTGRTGVYLTKNVPDDQNPEQTLEDLKDADPAVRRVAR